MQTRLKSEVNSSRVRGVRGNQSETREVSLEGEDFGLA